MKMGGQLEQTDMREGQENETGGKEQKISEEEVRNERESETDNCNSQNVLSCNEQGVRQGVGPR